MKKKQSNFLASLVCTIGIIGVLIPGCASSPAIIGRTGECEAIIYLESMHPNNVSNRNFKKFEEEFTALVDSMSMTCDKIDIFYKGKDALKGDWKHRE